MRTAAPARLSSTSRIVDERSGITTIIMMISSVEGVILAATLANHYWLAAAIQFLPFALLLDWLGRKAYRLGKGMPVAAFVQRPELSVAARQRVEAYVRRLLEETDRDWLTRGECQRLLKG